MAGVVVRLVAFAADVVVRAALDVVRDGVVVVVMLVVVAFTVVVEVVEVVAAPLVGEGVVARVVKAVVVALGSEEEVGCAVEVDVLVGTATRPVDVAGVELVVMVVLAVVVLVLVMDTVLLLVLAASAACGDGGGEGRLVVALTHSWTIDRPATSGSGYAADAYAPT
jgi:hypothetical protein